MNRTLFRPLCRALARLGPLAALLVAMDLSPPPRALAQQPVPTPGASVAPAGPGSGPPEVRTDDRPFHVIIDWIAHQLDRTRLLRKEARPAGSAKSVKLPKRDRASAQPPGSPRPGTPFKIEE